MSQLLLLRVSILFNLILQLQCLILIRHIPSHFQTERSDMLDTIRQLSRTVKLKDVIIGSFIPEDSAKGVERRAVWSQEEDCWTVQKLV